MIKICTFLLIFSQSWVLFLPCFSDFGKIAYLCHPPGGGQLLAGIFAIALAMIEKGGWATPEGLAARPIDNMKHDKRLGISRGT